MANRKRLQIKWLCHRRLSLFWLGVASIWLVLVPRAWALSGGEATDTATYPWVAALLDGSGSTGGSGYFCGGVLVHPSWVLTAAHCVAQRSTAELEVAFGLDRLSGGEASARYRVAEMFFHPRYYFRDGQRDGDLVLLRLATPVLDRQPIRFLESPVSPAMGNFFSLGWAEDLSGRGLAKLPLTVLTRRDASDATGEGFSLDAVPSYSGSASTGLCYGDSGTPLVVTIDGESRLAGVASYVVGNCVGYGVFSNLPYHRDWITSLVFPGFDAWRGAFGIESLWGDVDGDGLSNFVEFARVSDPLRPTPRDARAVPDLTADGRPALQFVHHRDAGFEVEHSTDLREWERLPPGQVVARGPLAGEDSAELLTVESEDRLEVAPRQFLRVHSHPAPDPIRAPRSRAREFYLKGDASFLQTEGRFERRYHVTGLVDGTTNFKYFTPFFSPKLQLIDRATGEVLLDEGLEGTHTLISQAATRASKEYEIVLSAVEPGAAGTFEFHFPQLPAIPLSIEVGRQPAPGVLDNFSDFDGNWYYKAYQIFGAVTGHTISVTLQSDAAQGGFRPYLAIRDENLEVVAETVGEPQTETTVTFTLESGRRYFAFATTVVPGAQGLFTLAARRVR